MAWLNGSFNGTEWYRSVEIDDEKPDIDAMICELDRAYRKSTLPERVSIDGLKELMNFVVKLRVDDTARRFGLKKTDDGEKEKIYSLASFNL